MSRVIKLFAGVILAASVLGCASGDDTGGDVDAPFLDRFDSGGDPDDVDARPRVDAFMGCSAANCDGCCAGDVCMPGTEPAACGQGGAACVACGAGGICTAETHTCEIDPVSKWTIIAASATVPEKKANGDDWDVTTGPDTFARGELDGVETGKTDTLDDTLDPMWNQPLATGIAAGDIERLLIEVSDNDTTGDDLIGTCTGFVLAPEDFEAGGAMLTCDDEAGWTMQITIEPN